MSTDRGVIHCFEARSASQEGGDLHPESPNTEKVSGSLGIVAGEIIRRTGVTRGYCLDLGCGDGSLSCELAQRTELQIVAVDPDPENVRKARNALIAAGLYGTRVTVMLRDLTDTGFPSYFADLIVSQRSLDQQLDEHAQAETQRLQRPFGGTLCLGKPGQWRLSVRGALDGSGGWTHQYADAANTVNSNDTLD